jgi:hypothetical protein
LRKCLMNSKLVEGGEKLKKEEEERLAQTRKI